MQLEKSTKNQAQLGTDETVKIRITFLDKTIYTSHCIKNLFT